MHKQNPSVNSGMCQGNPSADEGPKLYKPTSIGLSGEQPWPTVHTASKTEKETKEREHGLLRLNSCRNEVPSSETRKREGHQVPNGGEATTRTLRASRKMANNEREGPNLYNPPGSGPLPSATVATKHAASDTEPKICEIQLNKARAADVQHL